MSLEFLTLREVSCLSSGKPGNLVVFLGAEVLAPTVVSNRTAGNREGELESESFSIQKDHIHETAQYIPAA